MLTLYQAQRGVTGQDTTGPRAKEWARGTYGLSSVNGVANQNTESKKVGGHSRTVDLIGRHN